MCSRTTARSEPGTPLARAAGPRLGIGDFGLGIRGGGDGNAPNEANLAETGMHHGDTENTEMYANMAIKRNHNYALRTL